MFSKSLLNTVHASMASLGDIGRMVINVAGGALLGVSVGHLGNMLIPGFSITEEAASHAVLGTSGALLLGKAALNAFSRIVVEVSITAASSEMFMSAVRGNDPTNGGVALISLLMSDPKLQHDFRVLNSIIMAMMHNGSSLQEIEGLFASEESKVADMLKTAMAKGASTIEDKATDLLKSRLGL